MFDSNQTIRIAKDGANRAAALAWLKWLTTSGLRQEMDPREDQSAVPDKGRRGLLRHARKETVSLLAKGTPSYPWFYQRFPAGAEQGLGTILQGYSAGQTNRQQTLDQLDALYTKAREAHNRGGISLN